MKRIVFPMACIFALAALSGCVSKGTYQIKVDEADKCAANLQRQVADNQALQKELSTSQSDLGSAKRRLEECAAQVGSLSRERDDFKGRNETTSALYEELKTQNDKLNKLLQSKEVSQAQVIQETMDVNKKLRETNADLREQMARKDGEIRAAQDQLTAMTAERDGLRGQLTELQRQKEEDLSRLKSTYDELVGNLKGEIEAGQVQITRMKDRLAVNLVEKILFDTGQAEIKPAGLEVLKKVGTSLAKVQDKRIQIEGHTDNVPISSKLQERYPSNWELSAARAMAVVHFLQEKAGIDPSRLSAGGYGEYQPAVSNDTPEGRAANRRIEIVLLPPYEKSSEAQEKTGK